MRSTSRILRSRESQVFRKLSTRPCPNLRQPVTDAFAGFPSTFISTRPLDSDTSTREMMVKLALSGQRKDARMRWYLQPGVAATYKYSTPRLRDLTSMQPSPPKHSSHELWLDRLHRKVFRKRGRTRLSFRRAACHELKRWTSKPSLAPARGSPRPSSSASGSSSTMSLTLPWPTCSSESPRTAQEASLAAQLASAKVTSAAATAASGAIRPMNLCIPG
mmetsp:Transcript_116426/g.324455  ORF Transcript_116426/g.324455 Transcript_116426/m.324455 type:complete len:219 (-) Transcript_116426:71-727(-)